MLLGFHNLLSGLKLMLVSIAKEPYGETILSGHHLTVGAVKLVVGLINLIPDSQNAVG